MPIMSGLPATRIERLNAEQRLDRKLLRDEFRERAANFLRRVRAGAEWGVAADQAGMRRAAARQLLGRQDLRDALVEGKSAPKPEGMAVAEIEAQAELQPVEPRMSADLRLPRSWPSEPVPVAQRTDQPPAPPVGFVGTGGRTVSEFWSISGPSPGLRDRDAPPGRRFKSLRRA